MRTRGDPMPMWIDEFLQTERLPPAYRRTIDTVHVPLADRIAERHARTGPGVLTVGLCGPQGSGKSTLAMSLRNLLRERELSAVILSLDDLYLTRDERKALAQRVHPLLMTRGVPGTHDVELGRRVLADLRAGHSTMLPSFDKARDDRRPVALSVSVRDPVQVALFEGWCVGARPESEAALLSPVNELERSEDSDGTWRRYVNDQLAGPYQALFGALDMLVLLQAPGFDSVLGWRLEQEEKLRARILAEGGDIAHVMTEGELRRFIGHYERLTRHILREMPARADAVVSCRLPEVSALSEETSK